MAAGSSRLLRPRHKNNILQKIWHGLKVQSFQALVDGENSNAILDVGCAGGSMTDRVQQISPKARISAIDVYPTAINYARKKYPYIRFLVADAHKLPFKADSFDLVIYYETIKHVVNPKKVLAEIKRVLKKDGMAIVVMDSGNILFRLIWLVWENTKGRVWKGSHLHPFHHTELEKLIKNSGLKTREKRSSHLGMEVSFVLTK